MASDQKRSNKMTEAQTMHHSANAVPVQGSGGVQRGADNEGKYLAFYLGVEDGMQRNCQNFDK